MTKIILFSLVVIFVVLTIIVAIQPSDFRVVRTGTISAPPAAVFEHVNDLHKWDAWSPWAKLDPEREEQF